MIRQKMSRLFVIFDFIEKMGRNHAISTDNFPNIFRPRTVGLQTQKSA